MIKVPKSRVREPEKAFTTTEKILEALEKVKDEKRKLRIKLLAYSGIRLSEAVNLLKTFDPNKLEIIGKIVSYPLHKLGKTKKAIPPEESHKLPFQTVTVNRASVANRNAIFVLQRDLEVSKVLSLWIRSHHDKAIWSRFIVVNCQIESGWVVVEKSGIF